MLSPSPVDTVAFDILRIIASLSVIVLAVRYLQDRTSIIRRNQVLGAVAIMTVLTLLALTV